MRTLVAKSAFIKEQVIDRIDKGAVAFELQAFKQDTDVGSLKEFCRWVIEDMGKQVLSIHIHLMPKPYTIENISVLIKDMHALNCAEVLYKTAQYCAELQGFNVNIVLHKANRTFENKHEHSYIHSVLKTYSNINLLFENSSNMSYIGPYNPLVIEYIGTLFDYVSNLKSLFPAYADRIWALLDIAHLISDIRLAKFLLNIGLDVGYMDIKDVLKTYGHLLRSVHLCYSVGNGLDSTTKSAPKHGTPFTLDESSEMLFISIVHGIEMYLDKDVLVVFEVYEDDYDSSKNFSVMLEHYVDVCTLIHLADNLPLDRRSYSRLNVNKTVLFGFNELTLLDISKAESEDGSYYTLRTSYVDTELTSGYMYIGPHTIEVELIHKRDNALIFKTYDQNTYLYVDSKFGLDHFVFLKVD